MFSEELEVVTRKQGWPLDCRAGKEGHALWQIKDHKTAVNSQTFESSNVRGKVETGATCRMAERSAAREYPGEAHSCHRRDRRASLSDCLHNVMHAAPSEGLSCRRRHLQLVRGRARRAA